MRTYRLDDLVRIEIGRTPSRSNPKYFGDGYPWVTISDLNKLEEGKFISRTKEEITELGISESKIKCIPMGTVLYSFKLSIGKIAIAAQDLYTNEAIAAMVIKHKDKIFPEYLFYAMHNLNYSKVVDHAVMGKTLNKRKLNALTISIHEDLSTQRQVVVALNTAKALIDKRIKGLRSLEGVEKNLFLHYFQRYLITESNEFQTLDNIANVVSGITKGRKTREADLKEVPYLRVANVQDGYFDLLEIKTIEATASEIERYRIEKGDLLLTEGGDPNKLGRGDVWSEDETDFIFQNHLFRVRIKDRKKYLPSFLNALTGSDFGRAYFLKQAKQTTGIASINSRQMKAFPIPMVPMEEQAAFELEIKALKAMRVKLQHHSLPELETLFQSLLQRAFHGDLTIDPDLQLDGYLERENFEAIAADAVLIKTLIDRFNQAKTDALSEEQEEATVDEKIESLDFESEAAYNRAKDALFHLLKQGLVTQKSPEKEEDPFKTYLTTT